MKEQFTRRIMKVKKNLLIASVYLIITFTVIAYALPKTFDSFSHLDLAKSGKYSPVTGEAAVEADLFYRVDQYENTITPTSTVPFQSEIKAYLSREEIRTLYEPVELTDPQFFPEIPEGCEVSTNVAYELKVFELINEEREKRGLPLLTWNKDLSDAARKHSIDMACNSFFSHTNLDKVTFEERIGTEGYEYYAVGENLYAGDNVFNTPERAFRAWYYSKKHFEVMTHSVLTEVGIGYVYSPGSQHGGYFTADFATPE